MEDLIGGMPSWTEEANCKGADADISLLPGGDDPLVTVLGEDAPMAELVAEAVD